MLGSTSWRRSAQEAGFYLTVIDWECIHTSIQIYSSEYIDSAQILPGIKINWRELAGVLHPAVGLPYARYTKKDSENRYCNSAWQSWWLALQAKLTIANRINHSMLSPEYWSIAHIYYQATKVGIQTPSWSYDSQRSHDATTTSCYQLSQLVGGGDFRECHLAKDLAVSYLSGQPVICLLIGAEVYVKSLKSDLEFTLPTGLSDQIEKLGRSMGLLIMQVFFKVTPDHHWILHQLTPNLTWQCWENNTYVQQALWQLFQTKPTPKKRCAIPKADRPDLIKLTSN